MQSNANQQPAFPWKRGFRKIPPHITSKVGGLTKDELVVSCVRKIRHSEFVAGMFAHLGITVQAEKLELPSDVLPPPGVGRASRINQEGEEVVHRDLGKIATKVITIEAPNFHGYGTHEVTFIRAVYPRTFTPPALVNLEITLLDMQDGTDPTYAVRFRCNEVLNRTAPGFERRLLRDLNLLQENVGRVDVFLPDASTIEYLKSAYNVVSWEILPLGHKDAVVSALIGKMRVPPTPQQIQVIRERHDFLESLKPVAFIAGSSGFARYFGAQFADDFVVFETLNYGNAAYVMRDNWKSMSQLSRTELLSAHRGKFDRVVHTLGWENKLAALVAEYRKPKAA
jgi:hypothetical protein